MTAKKNAPAWRSALLRWGGSALILGLLFYFLRQHLHELLPTIRRVPPGAWLLLLMGYLGAHLFGVTKWRLMVNLAGAELSWRLGARCYFAGQFGNIFLPSLVGGDVIRAGLGMSVGRSRAGVVLGSLLDRMLDVVSMTIIAGTGALLLPKALDESSRRVFWGVAILLVLAAAGAMALARFFPLRRLKFRWRRKAARLRQAARAIARRRRYVALALALSLSMQLSFVTLMSRLSDLAGLDVPLYLWLFAYPLAKLSALLPVTQGGIGVREAALAALLAPFGAPPVRTVAVGLVWETIVISGGLLSGLLTMLLARLSPQRREETAVQEEDPLAARRP
jgi:uncharacterized membrane protein YbhN (UPF0104 family)